MDNPEIQEQLLPEKSPVLELLPEAQHFLTQSAKWARFLGIVSFIFAGLMAILALFVGTIMTALTGFAATGGARFTGLLGFIYLPAAILYFFIGLYLYQFGTRVRDGIAFSNSAQVSDGLGKLKSMFKLLGITTIVILALYVFIFLIALVAGAAMFSAFKPSY